MDTTVALMVISLYAGAFLAPLAVYSAARRTGHGAGWQALPLVCAGVIWSVLALGFAHEFLALTFLSNIIEQLAFLAVLALGVLAVLGFWLSVKRWPRRS